MKIVYTLRLLRLMRLWDNVILMWGDTQKIINNKIINNIYNIDLDYTIIKKNIEYYAFFYSHFILKLY